MQRLEKLLSLLFVVAIAPAAVVRASTAGNASFDAAQSARAVAGAPDGMNCTLLDFEGLSDQKPIPKIDGIASLGWVAVVDSDAGGTGNTAWEPSGDTWADWPTQDGAIGEGRHTFVFFDQPASYVSLQYASAAYTILASYDAGNDLLHAAGGAANYNQGPGGDPTGNYNKWDELAVESEANVIRKIKISGAIGQTAIDNLLVCRRASIAAAEFTQAIQQLQTIDELKADLVEDGQPPVPIVTHKPTALRVYFDEVLVPTGLTVEANLDGFIQTRKIVLMPGCKVDDARRGTTGCPSADFYFRPQGGTRPVTIRAKSEAGVVYEEHTMSLASKPATPVALGAVRVCDAKDESGNWLCENDYTRRLNELVPFLRKIAPTHSVRVADTYHSVRGDADLDDDGVVSPGEANVWWGNVAYTISVTRGLFDNYYDFYGIPQRLYYGMARPQAPGGFNGMASGAPGRGAFSKSATDVLGQDSSAQTLAHETFHLLGRQHTATQFPLLGDTTGCWMSTAADPDWPYSDNELRSGAALFGGTIEVGFDVAERRPLPWNATYDVMGYCFPRWVSPFTYTKVFEESLDASAMNLEPAALAEAGSFWQVAGTIDGETELASFDPLFEVETIGPTDQGTGTAYYFLVRDGSDTVLFARYFDVEQPQGDVPPGAEEPVFDVAFHELVPVQPEATKIEIYEWSGLLVGTLDLAGDAPEVQITSPAGGGLVAGQQTIAWDVTDADSDEHFAWVQYSTDPEGIDTWRTLAHGITDEELTVDFDELEGASTGAVVRVLVSDGVHTGSDTTDPFEVAPHLPEAEVLFPADQTVFRQGDLVWLQGTGHDGDDGTLEDEALEWVSDLDGVLGNGDEIQTTGLSVGTHEITLTATDSDANDATATVHVVVAGTGPVVTADVEALDTLPTTCVAITLGAEAGSVPLETFEYSLDNGATWTGVSTGELPYQFVVPGSGAFHLVARAFDTSGQMDAVDQGFLTDAPCLPSSTTTTTLPAAMCGDPSGDQQIKASDALLALRAAVNSYECEGCICDVNGSDSIEASDALRILRKSVGHAVDLICPAC